MQSGQSSATGTTIELSEDDSLMSLSAAAGVHWETIWNDPANAQLKKLRDDPMVLEIGDTLVIPEPREKKASGAADAKHVFRRKGIPAKVKMQFLEQDEPLAERSCQIEVDGKTEQGTTDAEGVLEFFIDPAATKAKVTIENEEQQTAVVYELNVGRLAPANLVRGAQQRLKNLGYLDAPVSGELDRPTERAIAQLQKTHEVEETGVLDDTVAKLLLDEHGS